MYIHSKHNYTLYFSFGVAFLAGALMKTELLLIIRLLITTI